MTSDGMGITARRVYPGKWQVSLPRRRSAVRGGPEVRPRHLVDAGSEAEAIEKGSALFEREYLAYKMGLTMRVADLVEFYIDAAERSGNYSPETARDYRNIVRRYVAPNFAKDADEARAPDFEALYEFLLAHGGEGSRGLSPNTVRKLHTVLRRAYCYLIREGVVGSNPLDQANPPARVHQEKRSLTDREYGRVLDALERAISDDAADDAGIGLRNMLFGAYLGVNTGARVGEICAITRGKVDWVNHALLIDHSMSEKGSFHRKEPKTQAGRRTVSLPSSAWEALERHYGWQARYLTDAQRDSDATPLCCTASGGFIRPSAMSRAFKDLCSSAGVELARGESFHVLRHTHASQLLSGRVNPTAVKERLGHSRIETTFGYSHVMPGEGAATAEDYGQIAARARKAGEHR